MDVMDCFDVLYPDLQLMVEVDHSAGHAKFREDGLHVGNMNVKYGGNRRLGETLPRPRGALDLERRRCT